tara:strand:- start:1357 stop:1596 length:240 start_codon:yes stop_codon:yes gene_type:complete
MSDKIFAVVTEKAMPILSETAKHVLNTLIRLRIEASDLAREIAPVAAKRLLCSKPRNIGQNRKYCVAHWHCTTPRWTAP